MHFIHQNILSFTVLILFSSQAYSATVRTVSSAKSQVTVNLDGDTYKKGDEICVFSSKNIKIECGAVITVRKSTVIIKLPSKKNIKKIKKGMQVKNSEASADVTSTASTTKEGLSLWMGWSPAIASPSTFNSVGYLAPETETPTTLWDPNQPVTSTLIGAAIQTGFPIGSLSIMPGFRYRMFAPARVDTDYVAKKLNPFVSSLTTGTAIGLFTDLRFFNTQMGSALGAFGTSGIDIEMSNLVFKSTKKDDTQATPESTVASAKSSLTVVSLRAGGGLNLIPFKPFGATLGVNLILPVAEFGKKFSGTIEQEETKGIADPGSDLKSAIGHKKNKFGIDAQLSILLAF